MFRLVAGNHRKVFFQLRSIFENANAHRNLYAASTLGMDGFLQMQERVKGQFANSIERFKDKMKTFIDDKPTNMIFTEDLRNMLHLAEHNETDVELIVKMLKKFNSQSKELRFGNYVFGPVVFRMFYHLGDVDAALALFKDPQLEGFFDQIISYQILMDLLYEKGRYQEVLDVFELIKARQVQGTKFARHIVVLTMAACYKMNTPESFKYCLELLKDLKTANFTPMRKAAAFAAGLALRQNAPHIALEIVFSQKDQQYLTMRNIKTMAYAEMDRPEDAMPILRSVLEADDPVAKGKKTFIRDVINRVRESIEKNSRKDLESDFKRIEKYLNDQQQIIDESMESILCRPITDTSYSAQKRDKSMIAASFNRNNNQRTNFNRTTNNSPRGKTGLVDLY